jgi:uncharacterized protein YndB with AHSA1/START domain
VHEQITVETLVRAPVEKAWTAYTEPAHIMQWNHASDDWHCPKAEADLRTGGAFSYRMEPKDGGEGFDFAGTFDEVVPNERIAYSFGGRKAAVSFMPEGDATRVRVSFDPESENSIEMQRAGWQAILDRYKNYTESLS